MNKQKTIAQEISIKGIGLHTGNNVHLTFKPAAVDSGINFIRTDIAGSPLVKIEIDNMAPKSGSLRCNCIGKDQSRIQTVEHLLAALCGLGITNINIEIDGNEVPGLDGSAMEFAQALVKAGIKQQDKQIAPIIIKEPVIVHDATASIMALPCEDFKISYTLDYKHTAMKADFIELKVNEDFFLKELAGARTFCLEEEVELLKKQGFGKGANYDNTLVLGKNGVINNKLRFANEFIRHKVLDLIGDLYVLGRPIKAHIIALRSGHALNVALLKKISAQLSKQPDIVVGPFPAAPLDINQIMKILPHRQPFLFVDRIIELEQGKRVVGIKNVTINDYFFRGHFPGKPVMPGVIIIEAMAQVGGVMMLACPENQGKIAFFMLIKEAKFRRTVVPGDQLVFEVVAGKLKSKTGQVFGKALVDGKVVAEAELMFAIDESS